MPSQLDPAVFEAAVSLFDAEGISDADTDSFVELLEQSPGVRRLIEGWAEEIRADPEQTARAFLHGLHVGWSARGAVDEAVELGRLL